MERPERLQQIYEATYEWASRSDRELVPRNAVGEAIESDVAVVGQALAAGTQRLSGLPYTLPDGSLSGGGQRLDAFLGRFGYTLRPGASRKLVYSTDLVPRFPGRNEKGSGDRKPTGGEIEESAAWLEAEIRLVAPHVVVLLGALPARVFLSRYSNAPSGNLEQLVVREWPCRIQGHAASGFAVYHPSGAWQFPDKAPAAYEYAASRIAEVLAEGQT